MGTPQMIDKMKRIVIDSVIIINNLADHVSRLILIPRDPL